MRRILIWIAAIIVLILALLLLIYVTLFAGRSEGTRIGATSTTFRIFGPNDKVAIDRFDDDEIAGVACYLARARKGGVPGAVGTAEDPSELSLSCARGPVVTVKPGTNLADANGERVFSERASILFKTIDVRRYYDKERKTLCYLVISTKLINGSPTNATSCINIEDAK